MYRKIQLAHIASILVVAASFVLLSPTTDSLSGIRTVFGYGAGVSVDNTAVLNGYAVADNSYNNGFLFRMRVTVDSVAENALQLRFNDWSKIGWGGTIPSAGNMLVNLANTTNSAVATASTYGSTLSVGADLDPAAPGVQQDVYVWLKVPTSTVGWAYSTTYGVMSSVQ